MRRVVEHLNESDIIGLQHAGRLVMRRPRLVNGVTYKAGEAIPTTVEPRRILQFHSLGHIEVLPEPAPVAVKPNPITDAITRAFQPTAHAGKRK